ncbi:helix-turn-helix domain-containing protein [Gordonia jacobaea]|uniref:helix-turn-helix domain-containing protein n=1 Tax=Gordonia jacobaea TaxID=122202 RepID=UPI003D75F300
MGSLSVAGGATHRQNALAQRRSWDRLESPRQLGARDQPRSAAVGINRTYLGQVERGQRSSRIEHVFKIAAKLERPHCA